MSGKMKLNSEQLKTKIKNFGINACVLWATCQPEGAETQIWLGIWVYDIMEVTQSFYKNVNYVR